MAPKRTQAVHHHHARPATPLRHVPLHGSTPTGMMPHSPLILTNPVEHSTGQADDTTANASTLLGHKRVPFISTVHQVSGGGLPELLTMSELCAFLKVKPHYIYSLTSTDRIPHRKFAGTLRFVKAEILQWVDRGRRGPPPPPVHYL